MTRGPRADTGSIRFPGRRASPETPLHQRHDDRNREQTENDRQREADRNGKVVRHEHLETDEREHRGEADIEVLEHPHHARQEEVERAQSQNREDVRAVHDERVLRHAEDRRDRVEGEHDVGRFEEQQNHEERGRHDPVINPDEETMPAVLGGDGPEPPEVAYEDVPLRMDLRFGLANHSKSGPDQEGPEQIFDPEESREEDRSDRDQRGPHDQRAENPPEEYAMLVLLRDLEIGEDDDEDEDVVDAQRLLDQVAGEEFESGLLSAPVVDEGVEEE